MQLGDFIRLKRGYDLPNSERISGDIPIISSSGITGYHNIAKIKGPGVVTGRCGTLGEIHYIDCDYWPLNTALYVEDFKENNPRFTAYLLMSLDLNNLSASSAVPGLNRNALHQIFIKAPDLKTQNQIVEILSAYDDLIANNRRRIALLGAAARRLYRHHFGPHSPKPRTGHWAVLGEVAEITMGQSPESKHYNQDGEGLPFHQGVSDFGTRFISHKTYTRSANRIAQPGDILCSVRAPVGRLNITHEQIAIGRGLSALRSLNGHQSLLFYQLGSLFVKEDMIGSGTIFASVTKKELTSQKIFQPDFENAEKFNRIASTIDAQIENLEKQTHLLTRTRDLLLPRLMQAR